MHERNVKNDTSSQNAKQPHYIVASLHISQSRTTIGTFTRRRPTTSYRYLHEVRDRTLAGVRYLGLGI